MMRVTVELKETAQPIIRDDVVNAYTKGPLYVLYRAAGVAEKYPLANVWRVTEDYTDDRTTTANSVGTEAEGRSEPSTPPVKTGEGGT